MPRIKICGLTEPDQAIAIAQMGVHALGFIGVPQSPRYVMPSQLPALVKNLPPFTDRVVVLADPTDEEIEAYCLDGRVSTIQLHGAESPERCKQVQRRFPWLRLIKAFRIRSTDDLAKTEAYAAIIDSYLLDAYHPEQLGGTGQTLNWEELVAYQPSRPWILAGGLTPDNVHLALSRLTPHALDLSSGVEDSPGQKNLKSVRKLLNAIRMF
ncbi:MAG: phosphoribosylanthranilate isomerase [Gloeobacterales cyanobacterium]